MGANIYTLPYPGNRRFEWNEKKVAPRQIRAGEMSQQVYVDVSDLK
jgi:hypothetical protein